MAHQVTFSVPKRSLGNKPIEISVKIDEAIHGSLYIWRAGIEWRPRNKSNTHYCDWKKFSEVMEKHC